MDENKEVNSTDPKREKVRVIPLSAIDDAPDHPFGVRDDEEMAELVESIYSKQRKLPLTTQDATAKSRSRRKNS